MAKYIYEKVISLYHNFSAVLWDHNKLKLLENVFLVCSPCGIMYMSQLYFTLQDTLGLDVF